MKKIVFDWEQEKSSVFELCIVHFDADRNWIASVVKLSKDTYLVNFNGRTILDQQVFTNINNAKAYVDNKLKHLDYKIIALDYKALL